MTPTVVALAEGIYESRDFGAMPGREDAWLYVVGAVEHPPLVWVTLAVRVRAVG